MATKKYPTADIDVSDLDGVPVGIPGDDGFLTCENCNDRLTDGRRQSDDPTDDADFVVVHGSLGGDGEYHMTRRYCEACGPDFHIARGDQRVSLARLGFDEDLNALVLRSPVPHPAVAHDYHPSMRSRAPSGVRREFKTAVLDELPPDVREEAEAALTDPSALDPVGVAHLENVAPVPENAATVAEIYAATVTN